MKRFFLDRALQGLRPASAPVSTLDPENAQPAGPLDLPAVLSAHALWLETRGRHGQQAALRGRHLEREDLAGANLRRADLRNARLSGANLTGANLTDARLHHAHLEHADLTGADLAGADLSTANLARANLSNAQLRRARLRDANLTDADLATAEGLLPGQLGGTVVANARLPLGVSGFEGLANVTEASKTTQSLFTTMVLVCAYAWLTVASTTDAQLLNNAAPPSSRMPILGIDIPLFRFYMVAPLLLVCVYVYFHLCLQRLWEELAELPAIFPDGRPLDRKAYPWMMTGLVRAHTPRLRENRSYLSRWQTRISSLLAWGLVPLTIFVLWGRYLRSHDWGLTFLHVLLLGAAVGVGVGFARLASATLRGAERQPFLWKKAWRDARAVTTLATLGTALGLGYISYGAIEGINPAVVWSEDVAHQLLRRHHPLDPRRWAPAAFESLGYTPSAVLYDALLSSRPATWSPQKPDLDAVHGADLEQRNLRCAKAYNAFLARAYLHYADLRWGDFREADLRRADLRETQLTGTNFRDAHLDEADLRKANLAQCRLFATELNRARLTRADLTSATLTRAELRGADLSESNLAGADLTNATLAPDDGGGSRGVTPTRLVKARLTGANLTGADLTSADLTGADLRNVNLTGATLKETILKGADLTGATGLTREQLSAAQLDPATRLPRHLTPLIATR